MTYKSFYFYLNQITDEGMRGNFAMDNTRHSDRLESKKAFVKLSRAGFFLYVAIFLCSLVAVALLVYNFVKCPQEDPQISENHFRIHDETINPTLSLRSSTQSPENGVKQPEKDLRLPRSIKPISYDLILLPFLSGENFTFHGEVEIKILIAERCKNVTLHAFSLQVLWNYSYIQKIDNDNERAENVSIAKQYFIEDKQFLVLETSKMLEVNAFYLVKLKFIGSIKDNLQGFYKSSYNAGSETRWIVSNVNYKWRLSNISSQQSTGIHAISSH